jgi:hypothetical protein
MVCRKCKKLFSAYLDGDLDTRERHRFEDHLAECERCAVDFAGFKEVIALTTDLPQIQPSPDFDRTLQAKLADSEDKRGFSPLFGRHPIAIIGMICVLLTFTFGDHMYKDRQNENRHMRSPIGREIMPMVRSHADENIFTNFVIPSVPAINAKGWETEDFVMIAPEDNQENRTFVLPFVMDERAQHRTDTNYVIKSISFIDAPDEIGF